MTPEVTTYEVLVHHRDGSTSRFTFDNEADARRRAAIWIAAGYHVVLNAVLTTTVMSWNVA